MFKNVASQKLTVYAFDSTTNLPKTGDAANLTAYRDLDDGGVTVLTDTSAAEKDATNAKGFYVFDLTQAETNGDKILFSCKSATANIVVLAMPAVVYTTPASFTSFAAQTGDAYAIVNSGTHGNAALKTLIDTLDNFVDTEVAAIIATLGTPSNFGSGATVAGNLVDIESQTDDIGAAGAGLTAVPWNAAWDAEVQSEVQDAIEANNLDHLVKIAVDTDFPTTVHLNSVIGYLADNGTSATFDRTTDSLEAQQIEHDATQALVAASAIRAALGLASANLDTQLSTIDDFLDTELADIVTKIGTPSNLGSGATLAANLVDIEGQTDDIGAAGAGLTAVWTMTLTESYRGTGAAGTPAQILYEVLANLVEHSNSGTTRTAKKLDGSTTAKTYTYDSASNPTSITETT